MCIRDRTVICIVLRISASDVSKDSGHKDRGHEAKAFKYPGQGLDISRSMAKKKTKANNDHKMVMTMMIYKILVTQENSHSY